MKNLIILLTIILFISCEEISYDVPNDVHQYLETFEYESEKRGLNYKIDNIFVTYVSDDEMPHAHASVREKKGKIIMTINSKYWELYKDYPFRREAIIFHELGHRPLMREHIKDNNSLMSESSVYVIVHYKDNREAMLNELFGAELQ